MSNSSARFSNDTIRRIIQSLGETAISDDSCPIRDFLPQIMAIVVTPVGSLAGHPADCTALATALTTLVAEIATPLLSATLLAALAILRLKRFALSATILLGETELRSLLGP